MITFPRLEAFGEKEGENSIHFRLFVELPNQKDYEMVCSLLDAYGDNLFLLAETTIERIVAAAKWEEKDITVGRMTLLSLITFVLQEFASVVYWQAKKGNLEEVAKAIKTKITQEAKEFSLIAQDEEATPFYLPSAAKIAVLQELYKAAQKGQKITKCIFSAVYPHYHEGTVKKKVNGQEKAFVKAERVDFILSLEEGKISLALEKANLLYRWK
jgi:hypothetical protein